MTLTEIDQAPVTAPRFTWTPRARVWAAGLLGFGLGVGGAIAVNGLRAQPAPAAARSSTVSFKAGGNASIDYAGIWTDGRDFTNGPVDAAGAYTVRAPYTVVFTVRSDPGEKAQCQIFIDGTLVKDRLADDESATCVQVVR